MNVRVYANHPAVGLGAKSGGDALCAIAEMLEPPRRQTAPATTLAAKIPVCLDIGSSCSTQSANIDRHTPILTDAL
jgi:hypothetical protein